MTAAIDGYKHRCRRILAAPGLAMLASIVLTEALLGAQGRWAEALPLHLCSVASIMAVLVAWGARGFALDYLWYLGIPGATLALLFPAPAVSRWQGLFDASYYATHALIVVIPVLAWVAGGRPRRGRALFMLVALQALALVAHAANCAFGTDFLFLVAPPMGTPLDGVFARSHVLYLLSLEAVMLTLCLFMQGIRALLGWRAD